MNDRADRRPSLWLRSSLRRRIVVGIVGAHRLRNRQFPLGFGPNLILARAELFDDTRLVFIGRLQRGPRRELLTMNGALGSISPVSVSIARVMSTISFITANPPNPA